MSRRSEIERKYRQTPKGKYIRHKANAIRRGVAFSLTFLEWWSLWESSGKWKRRGNKRGMYQMCRHLDRGGYELGNVYIGKMEGNVGERNRTVADAIRSGLKIKTSTVSEEAPF